MSKRLALYVFTEPSGNVRSYVREFLQGLHDADCDVLLISNGNLCVYARGNVDKLCLEVLELDKAGCDFHAWQAAIHHLGWEKVLKYDELLLCNNSTYGPIYPFAELFEDMAGAGDFWGIYSSVIASQNPNAAEQTKRSIFQLTSSYLDGTFFLLKYSKIGG